MGEEREVAAVDGGRPLGPQWGRISLGWPCGPWAVDAGRQLGMWRAADRLMVERSARREVR